MPDTSATAAPSRLQCSTCDKTYARISHLRRHEATHTNRRLIQCPTCSKAFVRIDVARRHLKSCTNDGQTDQTIAFSMEKRGKKPSACDRCSRQKVSCSLDTPCSRCVTSGANCTYLRVESSEVSSSGLANKSTSARPTFLLAMTTPSVFGTSETVSRHLNPGDSSFGAPWNMALPLHVNRGGSNMTSEEDVIPWSPSVGSISVDPDLGLGLEDEYLLNDDHSSQPSTLLRSRMEELIIQLSNTHQAMTRSGIIDEGDFNAPLAQTVFTAENLEHFVWGYFRHLHQYHAILHPPTFNCEEASLPLILAVFLFGSLYSAPIDDAISARGFFEVAEEFIFNHPDMQGFLLSFGENGASTADIQILQAALTISVLQNSKNDRRVRRRIQTERYPRLHAAIRVSGVLRAKHSRPVSEYTASTWEEFINEELRIRLAHWTQLNNTFMVGPFNNHTQIYMCEMVGDMPCTKELFEAENSQAFEQLLSEVSGPPPPPLASSLQFLLQDFWPGPNDEQYKRVTPETLTMIISALNTTVVIARTNCLVPIASKALLRACRRWKILWDAVLTNYGNDYESCPGFAKHAVEMCWVSMTILKVAQSGDQTSHYMNNIALDSLGSVNEFIHKYMDAL
ncbi:hypothetical protein BKA56DRAFT_506757 [Ilyonectria sp. MPI-CAGE-AT-0026]|nr:hypothetical protein BKA56DRAFT_506757 [Ilyonectria sp. MPI-CAGE-AT-0026]